MNNEDKVLGLIEKMYVDLSAKMDNISIELSNTKNELKTDIQKLDVKIENEITDKIRGLYDTREVTNGKLDILDEKMDKIQFDINNLTMKVAQSDNTIIELKRNLKTVK